MNLSSDRTKLLLAVGTLSALAVSAYGYYSWGSTTSKEDEGLAPALTEDEVVKIMENIVDSFKSGHLQTMQYIQQIKAQYMQQGMQIDEKELMKALLPQAEKMFTEAEQKVYDQFDVSADEVEDAVNTYIEQGNAQLKSSVSKIKKMYKELGGQVESDLSSGGSTRKLASKASKSDSVVELEDMDDSGAAASSFGAGGTGGACTIVTVEQFIGFVEAMAAKMAQFFDGYFDAFTAEYGRLTPNSSPDMQQRFQMGMIKLAEEVQQAFFAQCNMSEKEFESLLMQYQNDQRVQMAFMQLQYATQQRLQQRMAEGEASAGLSSQVEEFEDA